MTFSNSAVARSQMPAGRYQPRRSTKARITTGMVAAVAQGQLRPHAIDRHVIHDVAKVHVATHLSALGLQVQLMQPHEPYDFLLNGAVRVALRVALPSVHPVRVQVGERQYQYQYRSWLFNFHHHARIERYCDYLICLPLGERREPDLSTAFLIPWEARSGKTFSLHEARRPYKGRYTTYRGAWEALQERCCAAELQVSTPALVAANL